MLINGIEYSDPTNSDMIALVGKLNVSVSRSGTIRSTKGVKDSTYDFTFVLSKLTQTEYDTLTQLPASFDLVWNGTTYVSKLTNELERVEIKDGQVTTTLLVRGFVA